MTEKEGKTESAGSGGGGRQCFDYFTEKERALGYAREAVRQALVNIDAVAAPAGAMPVVLGSGWPKDLVKVSLFSWNNTLKLHNWKKL